MSSLTSQHPSRTLIMLAFASIYLFWGGTYLTTRFAVETIPPFMMGATRYAVSGGLLYLYLTLRRTPQPTLIHWRTAAVVGVVFFIGGNGMMSWSAQYLPSGLVALIISIVPIWVVLINWLRPKGKFPGMPMLFGVGLGLVGAAVLIGQDLLIGGNGLNLLALIAVVIASISWASGTIYISQAPKPDNVFMAAAQQMILGGVVLIILSFLTGESSRIEAGGISLRSALSWVYLVIFDSLIAYSAFNWLLNVSTSAKVSTYAYVNPIIAVILGWLLANESLTPRTIIAGGIILVAVGIITTSKKEEAPSQ